MDLLKHINIMGCFWFIDDSYVNDGNEFLASFKNIYPKELELKFEHQINSKYYYWGIYSFYLFTFTALISYLLLIYY